jgi:hypothetical protein
MVFKKEKQMQQITININPSIYEHIMFFLQNLPKNLIDIQSQKSLNLSKQDKIKFGLVKGRVTYMGDIMAEDKSINDMFYGT